MPKINASLSFPLGRLPIDPHVRLPLQRGDTVELELGRYRSVVFDVVRPVGADGPMIRYKAGGLDELNALLAGGGVRFY